VTADNTRFLIEASYRRRTMALERTREAIRHLDRTGQAITFCAVATEAGVSRSWLYREPTIRAEIERLRAVRSRPSHLPSAQRRSTESLQQRLETIRDEINRLRDENQRLRDQLARKLGHDRAAGILGAHVGDMSTPTNTFPHKRS
jgi:hypothetical protein